MMAVLLVPLAVALAGVLIYALAANSKLVRIGEILLFVGVFWLVFLFAGKSVRLP